MVITERKIFLQFIKGKNYSPLLKYRTTGSYATLLV